MQPILIAGAKASGKSIVRAILDGHSEIFSSPFHELFLEAFEKKSMTPEYFLPNDVEHIKQILACKAKYFQLERMAAQKEIGLQVGGTVLKVELNFDYYSFDKEWPEALLSCGPWVSPLKVISAVYSTLDRKILGAGSRAAQVCRPKSYAASMSTGFPGVIEKFMKSFPGGKVIYTRRPIEDLINGLVQRQPNGNDFRSSWFAPDALKKKWLNREFIESVNLLDKEALEKQSNGDAILVVDFSKLSGSHVNKSIGEIFSFLDVAPEEVNYHATLIGQALQTDDSENMLSSIVDAQRQELTEHERQWVSDVWNRMNQGTGQP